MKMKLMMKNNIVYKVTNLETEEVYVGITTKSIEDRKKDHLKKSKKGKSYAFQNAIATYGAEAFKWEQIDTVITTNELAKKEKEYILKYDSKENGYNSDEGGGIQKSIYQYNLKGDLVQVFKTLQSAGDAVNADYKMMSKVCLGVNKLYNDFYWTYDYVEKFIPQKDKRRKVVHQYTIQGEFIKEYKSVSEASKETGCNKTGIAKVCRQERQQCGNFKWYYN
jgi:group I intron endonuclease